MFRGLHFLSLATNTVSYLPRSDRLHSFSRKYLLCPQVWITMICLSGIFSSKSKISHRRNSFILQFSQPNMLQYPTGVILLHTSCLPHGVFFKMCFKETSFNKIDNYYYFKKDIFSNSVWERRIRWLPVP